MAAFGPFVSANQSLGVSVRHLSAACPDSIQCWSTVHVLACALAGCTLVALTLSATLAFSRVHRMDSPVGLEGVDHRLMPHQRLQIQLDNGYRGWAAAC